MVAGATAPPTAEASAAATAPDTEQLTVISGHTVIISEEGNETTYSLETPERSRGRQTRYWRASASIVRTGSGTYVLPDEYNQSRFDRALFDIELLRSQGQTDATTDEIPVIIRWSSDNPEDASAVLSHPGVRVRHRLDSVNATAVRISKSETRSVYQALQENRDVDAVLYDAKVSL